MDIKTGFITLMLCTVASRSAKTIEKEAAVFPKYVTVEEGQGFLVSFPSLGESVWERCSMTIGSETVDYELDFEKKSTAYGMFTPFSIGEKNCGLRVYNVTAKSNGQWIFKGLRGGDKTHRHAVAEINVLAKKDLKICPKSVSKNFCQIQDSVTKNINTCGNVPNWMNYFCHFTRNGAMEAVQVEVNDNESTRGESSIYSFTPVKEEKDKKILSCSVPLKEGSSVTMCIITHIASGTVYNIQNGLQHERYSSMMTHHAERICEFEVPTPVEVAEEGIWEMQMTLDNKKVHTCKFTLGWTEFVTATREKTQSPIVVDTLKKTERITCVENAPYPIEGCFLISSYSPFFLYNTEGDEMAKGNCKFDVNLNVEYDTAKRDFICGFNSPKENDDDFIQPITVRYFTNKVIDGKVDPVAKTMECHHIERTQIHSCVFVSPKKDEIISVPSDEYKTPEFEYFGRGFAVGACGVKFMTSTPAPGQWTCYINDGNKATPLSTEEGLLVE